MNYLYQYSRSQYTTPFELADKKNKNFKITRDPSWTLMYLLNSYVESPKFRLQYRIFIYIYILL